MGDGSDFGNVRDAKNDLNEATTRLYIGEREREWMT